MVSEACYGTTKTHQPTKADHRVLRPPEQGESEHISFKAPSMPLHLYEHIDPRTIIEATRKHRHL